MNNTALTSISLPVATTIGDDAFWDSTSLQSVTIGGNITNIGRMVLRGRTQPMTLTVQATTPPSLSDALDYASSSSNITIKVPMASVDAYKTAAGWSQYASQISGY